MKILSGQWPFLGRRNILDENKGVFKKGRIGHKMTSKKNHCRGVSAQPQASGSSVAEIYLVAIFLSQFGVEDGDGGLRTTSPLTNVPPKKKHRAAIGCNDFLTSSSSLEPPLSGKRKESMHRIAALCFSKPI